MTAAQNNTLRNQVIEEILRLGGVEVESFNPSKFRGFRLEMYGGLILSIPLQCKVFHVYGRFLNIKEARKRFGLVNTQSGVMNYQEKSPSLISFKKFFDFN